MLKRPARGFTLLEILLVTLLLGLTASAVTMSLGSAQGGRELEKLERRFSAAFSQAQELAIMDGRLIGLRIEPNAWQFMIRILDGNELRWQVLNEDKLLNRFELPPEYTLSFELDGFKLEQDEQREERKATAERTPQIFLFPGSELTPFTLTISERQESGKLLQKTLQGDEFGTLTMQADGELDRE